MNIRTLFITFLLVLTLTEVDAQRKCIIINLETKIPIRDVKVFVDSSCVLTSNYRGEIILPGIYHRIVVRKDTYQSLILNFKEVGDTISLLPNANLISEVVVNGKNPAMNMNFNRTMENIRLNEAQHSGFDPIALVLYCINKIIRHHKKRDMKKWILENY